jgi:hypothetical protein
MRLLPPLCCVTGKGVIVYPNPLVADLMVSAIANRIALLRDHRIEPNADMMAALARLQKEMDQLTAAVRTSIEFLEGRSCGSARSPQYIAHRELMSR